MENTTNIISLKETCEILGISVATGRNWIKLNKLLPSEGDYNNPSFDVEYIQNFKQELAQGKNASLKKRRNKKFAFGNSIYKSYVTNKCNGIKSVYETLNFLIDNGISISDELIRTLLAEASVQMLSQQFSGSLCHLKDFYLDEQSPFYAPLISDLIDKGEAKKWIEQYPKLFSIQYQYEENEDVLGLLYISSKNISTRKAMGSYYTPSRIVDKLMLDLDIKENSTILDPCCGTGNFLLQLPEWIPLDNIYGNDIDPISIRIARINITLKYKTENLNVIYHNFTESDYLLDYQQNGFDFIIGNPPWGYTFDKRQISELAKRYFTIRGDKAESFDVFLEKAFKDIKEGGIVSFVLPESILNVSIHYQIRKYILENTTIQSIDFLGNAFNGVQCPSIIAKFQKVPQDNPGVGLKVRTKEKNFVIETKRDLSPNLFCFKMDDQEYSIINKIDNLDNCTFLKGNSEFALGIVTGGNSEYISQTKTDKNEVVLKGSDILKYRIKKADNYIQFVPLAFQQVAPTKYYRAPEKLLYRFICNKLVFAYDDKQTLSLNSCNILIPTFTDLSCKYVMAILNSRVAQFYFTKVFDSVKILRFHIENIPLAVATYDTQKEIENYVDKIIKANKSEIEKLYDELDLIIAGLYQLTDEEYQIVKDSISDENNFLI